MFAWNAAAFAGIWIWSEIASHTAYHSAEEDWSGLVIAVVVVVLSVFVTISTLIGILVAEARTRRLAWLAALTSTGAAILAGTRVAAWGLCSILLIPLALLVRWVVHANG
jgi:hypothetical protein